MEKRNLGHYVASDQRLIDAAGPGGWRHIFKRVINRERALRSPVEIGSSENFRIGKPRLPSRNPPVVESNWRNEESHGADCADRIEKRILRLRRRMNPYVAAWEPYNRHPRWERNLHPGKFEWYFRAIRDSDALVDRLQDAQRRIWSIRFLTFRRLAM